MHRKLTGGVTLITPAIILPLCSRFENCHRVLVFCGVCGIYVGVVSCYVHGSELTSRTSPLSLSDRSSSIQPNMFSYVFA